MFFMDEKKRRIASLVLILICTALTTGIVIKNRLSPPSSLSAGLTYSPPYTTVSSASPLTALDDVPYIYQNEKYPTGCESVSAVMVLQYYGISVSVEQFIDSYLETAAVPAKADDGEWYGADPREVFLGDPYSPLGWGCYPNTIIKALKKLEQETDCGIKYKHLSGSELKNLCKNYVDKDIPVLIWATQGMQATREGRTWKINGKRTSFTWIAPMHCLVLVGYDDNYYYFNDPQTQKNMPYKRSAVETAYAAIGKEAVVITK